MRAILIPWNSIEPIREVDHDGSLEALQEFVGGHIEYVRVNDPEIFPLINEEGKLMNLPPNERATAFALGLGGMGLPGDYIAGDMIVCGCDAEGETVDLPDRVALA